VDGTAQLAALLMGGPYGPSLVPKPLAGALQLGRLPRALAPHRAHRCGMEIIVEIHKGDDGRPAGTVRSVDEAEGRSFSGNLAFLALVENLYLAERSTTPPVPSDEAGLTDDNTKRREQ
jgi:hypothetical protein